MQMQCGKLAKSLSTLLLIRCPYHHCKLCSNQGGCRVNVLLNNLTMKVCPGVSHVHGQCPSTAIVHCWLCVQLSVGVVGSYLVCLLPSLCGRRCGTCRTPPTSAAGCCCSSQEEQSSAQPSLRGGSGAGGWQLGASAWVTHHTVASMSHHTDHTAAVETRAVVIPCHRLCVSTDCKEPYHQSFRIKL